MWGGYWKSWQCWRAKLIANQSCLRVVQDRSLSLPLFWSVVGIWFPIGLESRASRKVDRSIRLRSGSWQYGENGYHIDFMRLSSKFNSWYCYLITGRGEVWPNPLGLEPRERWFKSSRPDSLTPNQLFATKSIVIFVTPNKGPFF